MKRLAIRKVHDELGVDFTMAEFTPRLCNTGYCDMYADAFIETHGGELLYTEVISDGSGTFGHTFVKLNGKYYDAEAPNGVSRLIDLPYFKRAAKYYGRSLTEEEISTQITGV